MSLKNKLIMIIAFLGIGFILGYYLSPKPASTQAVVEKEVIRKDIVTVTKEVVRPDGTKETITTVTDKSKESSHKEVVKTESKAQYKVNALVEASLKEMSQPVYGVGVERRIIGPVWAGVSVKTNGWVGVSVGWEF